MFVLVLIMMPLATTEIGTDGWITGIMEGVLKNPQTGEEIFHPGWILVYTSAIMMVLRFFAGPIVHNLSPLGLLAVSAILAIVGLITLSTAAGTMIFIAATLYGFGKTFFWPTMLGVVAEQTPKGGALTLNAISGIGMLAVGTLGFPFIGALQSDKQIQAVVARDEAKQVPGLIEGGQLAAVSEKSIYEIIRYSVIDDKKLGAAVAKLPAADQEAVSAAIGSTRSAANQGALSNMALFPGVMLVGYLCLILYFKSMGGYQAQVLVGHEAKDEEFTGGVEGAVE
jgi:MFS family permease